jgi:riboflavin kinase
MRRLVGVVEPGVGDLTRWMTTYSDRYASATGERLWPGSLNVRLPEPWIMTDVDVRLEAREVGRGINLQRAWINRSPCWLFRTDGENGGLYPEDVVVIQVLATMHLRTALNLVDGTQVEINLDAVADQT